MYSYHDFMVMKGLRQPSAASGSASDDPHVPRRHQRGGRSTCGATITGLRRPPIAYRALRREEYWRRVVAAIERQAYAPPEPRTRIGIALAYAIQERQRCAENIANRLAWALR